MKITLVMVSSVNGKITRNAEPDITTWTSAEDQKFFSEIKTKFRVIIMGRHTFEYNRPRIRLSDGTLRIVLTKNPESYLQYAVPGQLEFSREKPEELIRRLETLSYAEVLLVGGAEINSSFLEAGLVDELQLTIEPKFFGTGKNMIAEGKFGTEMKLTDVKKLNAAGTLHLTYSVIKNV